MRDATAGSLHALASVLEPLSWLGCCFKVCATSGDAEQKPPEVRSGVKVEVVVLGFPPIVPNSPYGLCGRKESELRSCVKVEVAVLGSPSLIVRTVFVDVK